MGTLRRRIYRVEGGATMENALLDQDPSKPQTADQIEAYLRGCKVGDRVPIRNTQNHTLEFKIVEVMGIAPGRLYTNQSPGWGGGAAWFLRSGKNCRHPTGQSKLVIPTDEVRAFAEKHPRGASVFGLATADFLKTWGDKLPTDPE
jgi:hypothetical protein